MLRKRITKLVVRSALALLFLQLYNVRTYVYTYIKEQEDTNIFKDLLINSAIKSPEVRLIDMDGSMVGVVSLAQAQRMADERNLDLVLFSPQAVPPVCKILDYGKYRYDQVKKDKQAQKNSKGTEVKEIQLSQTIDIGDLKTKAKHTRAFIEDKNKVKVTIRMRGRQNAHPELSVEMMAKFFEMVSDVAIKEKEPVLEGRNVTMMLGPIPAKK